MVKKNVFSRSFPSGNKCYKFVFVDDGTDGFNWFDAREACQAESGLNPDLATIKSDEEAGKWITVSELMVVRQRCDVHYKVLEIGFFLKEYSF